MFVEITPIPNINNEEATLRHRPFILMLKNGSDIKYGPCGEALKAMNVLTVFSEDLQSKMK